MGAEQESAVRSLVEALGAGDLDAVIACFASDAHYHVWAWREPVVGRAAIRAEFERQLSIFTGYRSRFVHTFSTDAVVFVERVDTFFIGGNPVNLHAAGAYEFDDEALIARWRDYYDTGELDAQLSA